MKPKPSSGHLLYHPVRKCIGAILQLPGPAWGKKVQDIIVVCAKVTFVTCVDMHRSIGGVCSSSVPRLAAREGRAERFGRLETCRTWVEADGMSSTSFCSTLYLLSVGGIQDIQF